MDSEYKQRISLYLDKNLVAKADEIIKEYGFKSRNEFFSYAIENYVTDEILKEKDGILNDKLARAVADLSENNAKAISKGLFRYAVQLEMVMRIIAQCYDTSEDEIKDMRREAINNVRRTRGKVHFEEILNGYYNE